ncbi:MAG: hypothetical protein WCE49_09940 [Terrimicrobiaceae bacterium]
MKLPLLLIAVAAGAVWINLSEHATACGYRLDRRASSNSAFSTSWTTLENRADLYSPQNYFANGPYTRIARKLNHCVCARVPSVKRILVPVSTPVSGSFRGGK